MSITPSEDLFKPGHPPSLNSLYYQHGENGYLAYNIELSNYSEQADIIGLYWAHMYILSGGSYRMRFIMVTIIY